MSITKEGLFKYQALNERQRKNLLILDMVRKKGPISKSDLSKQVGYNIVTISNYLEEYMKKSLIQPDGLEASSGGRKPRLIELNKNEVFLIGIDFGRNGLSGIVTDFMLNVIAEAKIPRPAIDQEEVNKALISLIKELLKKSSVDVSKIKFAAVGTYGMLEEKNSTIKGLDEEKGHSRATIYFEDLKKRIERELNVNAFFGADASFAAFGERSQNPTADVNNMLYIFQDIGKGVVIKGEIYCSMGIGTAEIEGLTGMLTEEEKLRISEHSLYLKPWNFQMSLKKEAINIIEQGIGTKIVELLEGDLEKLNEEVIIKAAQAKDDVAIELIQGIAINLGVRVSYLINLFLPQVVIIGGGIEKAGELLFSQIKKTVEKLSLDKPRRAVKILPSVLGSRAVSFGAASVALREVFLEA